LVARVLAADDRPAFAELVHRHQSAVRRFLRSLTHPDHARADDLAQDTFIQAYRALARYRGGAAFNTWLLGIAHNLWRNDRRRHRTVALQPAHLEACEPAPAGVHQSDLRSDLGAALRQLAPDEQTALHLCYQQGLSHHEIARILDWPLGTVKTHLLRGKEKLRLLLASWNPET
jgi:RNA polymerase sigma-70 factor (ECF subfamily)